MTTKLVLRRGMRVKFYRIELRSRKGKQGEVKTFYSGILERRFLLTSGWKIINMRIWATGKRAEGAGENSWAVHSYQIIKILRKSQTHWEAGD